jgi:hypothetical protein
LILSGFIGQVAPGRRLQERIIPLIF